MRRSCPARGCLMEKKTGYPLEKERTEETKREESRNKREREREEETGEER